MICVVCNFRDRYRDGYESHPKLPTERLPPECVRQVGDAFAMGLSFARRLNEAASMPNDVVDAMCMPHRVIYQLELPR